MAAVQTVGGDIVLFDGEVEKVITQNISETNSERYYLYSEDSSAVKIFLNSQTNSNYEVYAKVVSNGDFIADGSGILYPQNNEKDS